jgi:hypothetical protein
MSKLRNMLTAVAALTALAAAGSASANVLVNGDFETGLAGWTPDNASIATATGQAYGICCGVGGSGSAYQNNHFATFGSGGFSGVGTLSQNYQSIAGGLYTLSFDIGALAGSSTNVFTVSVDGVSHDYNVVGATDYADAFDHYSFSFTGTGGTQTVSFALQSFFNDDTDAVLDNVSLSVPEPTTWALMILGFGGVGAALRTRRRAGPWSLAGAPQASVHGLLRTRARAR